MQPTAEEIVRAAAKLLLDMALKLIEVDSHSWSTRPCQTCSAISELAGRPFGCLAYAKKKGV